MSTWPRYPIEPWREFIAGRFERFQLEHPDLGQKDFAARLGVSERCLYRWLNDGTEVPLNAVDKVLTRLDLTYMLDEFCPIGQEVKRAVPGVFNTKCAHGDRDRAPSGYCRLCKRAARERARVRRLAA